MTWHAELRTRAGELDIDVTLDGGQGTIALIGPNGAGKTSILRSIAGVHRPVQGRLEIDGATLLDSAAGIDLPAEARRIGYVPQGYGLFPHLDVLHNVAFGLSTGPGRLPRAERYARAQTALDDLGCDHLARRHITALSGGERQRVALARALVVQPRLVLLDEPMAALDATTRRSVRALLAERLRAAGALVITHDLADTAALADHVIVLERGRVVQRGSLEELRAAPATDFVAEWVGS